MVVWWFLNISCCLWDKGATLILTFNRLASVLISSTFLWEFECWDGTNVGLAAGRYSGNSRPDRYRTPQALQRVFGPNGPSLHSGVSVDWQWAHFLTSASRGLEATWRAGFKTVNELSTFSGDFLIKSMEIGCWNNLFLLSLLLAFEVRLHLESSRAVKSHGFIPEYLTRFDLLRAGIACSDLIDKPFSL